tara:strand:+ start:159478 stop:163257 length:3780 start_codon:yes stop_codon:yes gene_type:complete
MQRMTQGRNARVAGRTLAAVSVSALAVSLVAVAGCASGVERGTTAKSADQNNEQSGYVRGFEGLAVKSRLERLIDREEEKPSVGSFALADRIMDGRLVRLTPGTAEFSDAVRPLDEVLALAVARIPAPAVRGEVAMLPQIAKGYVRARAAMLNDDAAGAVAIYEQIAGVSPQSTEILIGLGDAYMRLGDRGQAVDAYLRAVELGDRTIRALVYGAMGSTNDPDRVIELGSMAWGDGENSVDDGDLAGRLLGGVMLGRALIEDGQLAAGAEVMTRAMGMLDGDTARDPRFRRELIQLYTQRAEQYASLGDAWMMLEQPARALEVYELARGLAGDEPIELMARRVAAELLAGHSGLAAMGMIDWIDAHPGDDSGLLHHLVGIVGEHALVGGLLKDSIAQRMRDAKLPVSHRRALLGLVLTLEHDRDASVLVLSGVDPVIVSPVACARVLGMFDAGADRLGAVMGMVERSPSIGSLVVPALIRLDGRTLESLAGVTGDSETAELVRCLIVDDLQRPDLLEGLSSIDGAIDRSSFDSKSTAWLIAHARAAVLSARWELADALFEACSTRAMNGADHPLYVDTLMVANRTDEAVEAAEARAQSMDGNAADWLVLARMHQQAGDGSGMVGALEMALELDPYDEGVYEQLITVLGSGGELGDVEQLRVVTRSLGQRLPRSAMVSLIRAHEMASAGAQGGEMLAQSERVLVDAHAQHRYREIGIDLLLSVWRTQMTQGDQGAVARGLAWIDAQREDMGGSIDLASAKARMMVLAGDGVRAEDFLDGFYERMPSRRVGRLHEGLIRSDESRREEADRLALTRLDGLVSVEDCLERLERAGGLGVLGGGLDEYDADELVPVEGDWSYSLGESLRIVRVLGAVAQRGVEGTDVDLLLTLVERTRQKSAAGMDVNGIDPLASLDLIELVILPASDRFVMDDYEELVRSMKGLSGGGDPFTVGVQSVLRSQDAGTALDLVTRLTITDDGMLDEKRVADLASLIGQIGSAEDLVASIDWMDRAGLMIEARDAVVGSLGVLQEGSLADKTNPDGVKADFAYSVAVVSSFYKRDDVSPAMYGVALGYDGDHAWANNDLGYRMIEDGGDLEVAERHLVLAHEADPKAASITDSLAWVRYAMGVIEDEVDGDGNVVRRGALGLLEEALGLEDGTSNATIYDHLGDSLWMVGDFERAVGAWLDAESRLRERLTELSNQENVNAVALESIREELSSIRFKIADGEASRESGRVPAVAPNRAGLVVPNPADIVDEVVPEK